MKYLLFIILFISGSVYSQDAIFSQYFMMPETINSSFTGALQGTKLGVIRRSQWVNFGLKVDSNYGFIDTWFEGIKSGVGISILNHNENKSNYSFNEVNLNYALAIQLSDTWYFRPSISTGIGVKDYGFNNLLLEDQININSGQISANSMDPVFLNEKRFFVDFSSSLLFNNENSWVGLTLKHLNRPNISMTDEGNTPLDIFISLHSYIEFPLKKYSNNTFTHNNNFYFLSNFMMQSKYSRFDLGSQYVYNNQFLLGFLVATNPIKNDLNSHLLTSFNSFVGLKWEGFKFGYSYDMNLSDIGFTGGIHEFSISYDFGINLREINRYKCVRYF